MAPLPLVCRELDVSQSQAAGEMQKETDMPVAETAAKDAFDYDESKKQDDSTSGKTGAPPEMDNQREMDVPSGKKAKPRNDSRGK